MTAAAFPSAVPETWAGVECAYLGPGAGDQLGLTGHAERLADLDLIASLGVTAVRYPVLWGRGPERSGTDWRWADERLGRLRELGVRPIVGLLHHGAGPVGSSLLDPGFPERFGRYAGRVARRYPWIREWLPINEPLVTARFGGLYGIWAPYAQDHRVFARLIVGQALAARAAFRAIRGVIPDAVLIQNEDGGRALGTAEVRDAVDFDNERRWLPFDLLLGRVDEAHPMWAYLAGTARIADDLRSLRDDPCPLDVVGLDVYVTSDRYLDHRLERFPERSWGGDGQHRYADVELVRTDVPGFDPFRRSIRETWQRYGLPVALMEVHLDGEPADQVAWWSEACRAVREAVRDGIDVRGLTAWAVFGSRGWPGLLVGSTEPYDPGAFDALRDPPALTALGRAIGVTAAGGVLRPPPVTTGWWRRPERVLYRCGRLVHAAALSDEPSAAA